MVNIKTIIVLCFFYALLNVSGSALIKSELAKFNLIKVADWITFLLRFKVISGLSLNFLSILMIFKALEIGKFTYVLPVSVGINFTFAVIVGYFIFHDALSFISFLGMGFIFLGVVLMSLVV